MTLNDFIALPQAHQLNALGKRGVYLSGKRDARYEVTLFRLQDFFVEVYFSYAKHGITHLSTSQGGPKEDL